MKQQDWQAVVLVTFLLAPSVVSADWQFTRWGMGPEQVIDAGRGAGFSLERDKNGEALNLKGYSSGQLRFDLVSFRFGPQGLRAIQLMVGIVQAPGIALRLREALISKYGSPSGRNGETDIWRDEAGNNLISLACPTLGCWLEYKPLRSSDAGGL
jgi:hypothetical protein